MRAWGAPSGKESLPPGLDGTPISPRWWCPGLALLVLGCLGLAMGPGLHPSEWRIPGLFLIANGLILLPTVYRALRRDVESILADHLLVLVGAYLVYFVIGAMMIPFGSPVDVDIAVSYYRIDAPLGMRAIAVNSIGLGFSLIAGSMVRRRWVSTWGGKAIRLGRSIPQGWIILLFLLIGGGSFLYVLPTDIGLRPGVVSGIFRTGAQLLLVAMFLVAAYEGPGKTWFRIAAILLVSGQAFLGLLMLNKAAFLLPLAASIGGLGWRLGVRRVLLPGLATLLIGFLLIGNLVNLGRTVYGVNKSVDWSERISMMAEGLLHPRKTARDGDFNSWSRFCYLPPQTAALDMYDHGRGGDDYKKLGWVFLPRALFPDKPVITESSREFFYKLTGMDTSSTGQGIFVNGYYNLGWFGVVMVGLVVGCLLSWTSALALEIYRAQALIWVPVALLGSFMAFRIDGAFLADYWGTFSVWFYILLGWCGPGGPDAKERAPGMMRILFVGESWKGSSARSLREALAAKGNVLIEDLADDHFLPKHRSLSLRLANRLLGPLQRKEFGRAVLRSAGAFRPDVVVIYKGWGLGAGVVVALQGMGLPVVNVLPDYSPHAYGSRMQETMGHYDLVISTKPFHPALWKTLYGYDNPCVCVPHGYDPEVHLWEEPAAMLECDVALCGTWRLEYHRLLQAFAEEMSDKSLSVSVAGHGWEGHRQVFPQHWKFVGPKHGRAYGEFLRQARIVIAPVNREVVIGGAVQPGDEDTTRTYELAAARCFFLHQRTDFVRSVYDEASEVPLWENAAELASLVRRWLPDEIGRKAAAARAHVRAVPAYSIPQRAVEVLRHLEELVRERRNHRECFMIIGTAISPCHTDSPGIL